MKPSHGDDPDAESNKHLSQSTFDSRCTEHQVLEDKQSLSKLLNQVQKSVPNTWLQQFWVSNCPDSTINSEMLWYHVVFSHIHASTFHWHHQKIFFIIFAGALNIRYSSSLTLHSHVKTHVLSPAFCVELLNISRVFDFYSQFWCARACIFFEKYTCVHEHTLHEYTQNCTSTLTC